jgi:hypothetical protein
MAASVCIPLLVRVRLRCEAERRSYKEFRILHRELQ